MTTRTTQTVVHFQSPFKLPDMDTPQPPGDYRIDLDEELLEAGSRLAARLETDGCLHTFAGNRHACGTRSDVANYTIAARCSY